MRIYIPYRRGGEILMDFAKKVCRLYLFNLPLRSDFASQDGPRVERPFGIMT